MKAAQFDVDRPHDDGGRRALKVPLDDDAAVDRVAGQNARGAPGTAEGVVQAWQGFTDRRENCQRNDRHVEDRDALERRDAEIAFRRQFEQPVSARRTLGKAPMASAAIRANGRFYGRTTHFFKLALGLYRSVRHLAIIVSREQLAILRVDDERRGLVVSTGRNSAWVAVDGEPQPLLAQLRRMTGKRFMPVPGDAVIVRPLSDGEAVVERIEPRAFTLERFNARGRAKTMAANIDAIAIVTSLAHPPPRLATLDQLLAFCELQGVRAVTIFTKPDMSDADVAERLLRIYRSLGYETIVVNPKGGDNLDELRAGLRGRRAMLAGSSGVGKSTIFRALGGEAVVGELSRFGLGRQTTTTARLYRMGDGFLIDSPGIGAFGLESIPPNELAHAFREMREPLTRCRFSDCTHLMEPGCAVRAAVDAGEVAPSRYASYVRIAEGALSQSR